MQHRPSPIERNVAGDAREYNSYSEPADQSGAFRSCGCTGIKFSRLLQKKRYPRKEDTFWDSLVVELAQALLVSWRRRAKNPRVTSLVLAKPVPKGIGWGTQNP